MLYYPIFLDIKNKPCLVIGGGNVAERKVKTLLEAGAKITILSPDIKSTIKPLVRKNARKIKWIRSVYKPGSLKGFYLAISATGAKSISRKIREEALKEKVILNVADEPLLSDFIAPSVLTRGDMTIAVSSSGKSPYLAKAVREALEELLPQELSTCLELISAVRNNLLKIKQKNAIKIRIYKDLASPEVFMAIRAKDRAFIDGLLRAKLGSGFTLKKLGVRL